MTSVKKVSSGIRNEIEFKRILNWYEGRREVLEWSSATSKLNSLIR